MPITLPLLWLLESTLRDRTLDGANRRRAAHRGNRRLNSGECLGIAYWTWRRRLTWRWSLSLGKSWLRHESNYRDQKERGSEQRMGSHNASQNGKVVRCIFCRHYNVKQNSSRNTFLLTTNRRCFFWTFDGSYDRVIK
jgi:hypothetical protein